jgi:alginate O-acetyltransferase complex protein AlgI
MKFRTYFNLAAVFALVGIWHGANWTFLVWGGYHGALLIAERIADQRALEDARLPALRRGVVFLLVTLGWVIFRAEDLSQLAAWTQALFRFDGLSLPLLVQAAINHQNAVLLAFGLAVCLLPRNFVAGVAISQGQGAPVLLGRALLAGVVLPFALASALSETFRPFLYFQF